MTVKQSKIDIAGVDGKKSRLIVTRTIGVIYHCKTIGRVFAAIFVAIEFNMTNGSGVGGDTEKRNSHLINQISKARTFSCRLPNECGWVGRVNKK